MYQFWGIKNNILVFTTHRCVISTVYSVLSNALWKKTKITGILLGWDSNPTTPALKQITGVLGTMNI